MSSQGNNQWECRVYSNTCLSKCHYTIQTNEHADYLKEKPLSVFNNKTWLRSTEWQWGLGKMDLKILFDPEGLSLHYTFTLTWRWGITSRGGKNERNGRLWLLMQIKKDEGCERKCGDKEEAKVSFLATMSSSLSAHLFLVLSSQLFFLLSSFLSIKNFLIIPHLLLLLLSSILPLSSYPPSLILSFHSLVFLSPLWSICDPDIHHRRLTSCVWASSVPRSLLFIPRCVCVWAVWTAYEHTSMGLCVQATNEVIYNHPQFQIYACMYFCVFMSPSAHFVYLYTSSRALLYVFPSTRPPSWSQVIHNLARQRKFVPLKRTQTGRCT